MICGALHVGAHGSVPRQNMDWPQLGHFGGSVGAGWSWADAMRARERNAEAEKAGIESGRLPLATARCARGDKAV